MADPSKEDHANRLVNAVKIFQSGEDDAKHSTGASDASVEGEIKQSNAVPWRYPAYMPEVRPQQQQAPGFKEGKNARLKMENEHPMIVTVIKREFDRETQKWQYQLRDTAGKVVNTRGGPEAEWITEERLLR